MIDSKVIRNLEVFGERYCDRYLKSWRVDISDNWWTALRFFFNHAFMRGRKDQLSEEYFLFAMDTLKRYFGIPDNPAEEDFQSVACRHYEFVKDFDNIIQFKRISGRKLSTNSIREQAFYNEIVPTHPMVSELVAKTAIRGQRALNNDKDLLMVLSALAFLTCRGMPANVHNYMVGQLSGGNAIGLAKAIKEIYSVGDKLSSFILRDIILMNPNLRVEDQSLVFPVDTWVQKIAKRWGCEPEDHQCVRQFFVDQLEGASAAKVAAGLWYIGFNSLEILLMNLDKIDLTSREKRL